MAGCGWAQETLYQTEADPPTERCNFGVCLLNQKALGAFVQCTQKRLNRSRCHLGADSCGPKKPHSSWDPPQKGAISGDCPAHSKAWAVYAAGFAAKGIIQS